MALWLATRDPRVPWLAKGIAFFTAAYALSPVDLIPDFIPVLGLLDDLLIVPAGIWLALRLIPPKVMADMRDRADGIARQKSGAGLVLVVALWLAVALAVWWWWTGTA